MDAIRLLVEASERLPQFRFFPQLHPTTDQAPLFGRLIDGDHQFPAGFVLVGVITLFCHVGQPSPGMRLPAVLNCTPAILRPCRPAISRR